MSDLAVGQQIHGYRNGHQLLDGTAKLAREDQDLVDRLSDIAGPIRPGEVFNPYLTTYPLPSGRYYIIARTWQDLGAPRAGCVKTRSLLVPTALWTKSQKVEQFVRAMRAPSLTEVEWDGLKTETVRGEISDTRVPEIVEALFLEARQPVVVFGSPDAEQITLQVLKALWPARRKTFSSCTWCLSPRRINGRDFDLVFAPVDARRRFGDWEGRRVDPTNRAPAPRHRWTAQLVEEIFSTTGGRLGSDDALGVLDGDPRGDEAALRLSLMWRELESKAKDTPNAVLGMLDILNSRTLPREFALRRLEPLAVNAARLAASDSEPALAWRFFLNLLLKYPTKLPGSDMLRVLRAEGENLAGSDPDGAIDFLAEVGGQGQRLPAVLAAGIGDGLSTVDVGKFAPRLRSDVGPDQLLALLAHSRPFAAIMAAKVADGQKPPLDAMKNALIDSDASLLRRARRNLLPVLRSPRHASLLAPTIGQATAKELADSIRTLARSTGLRLDAFDGPLVESAAKLDLIDVLRSAAIQADCGEGSDRLILASLSATPADVRWIYGATANSRVQRFLAPTLARADDHSLQILSRDPRVAGDILRTLSAEPKVQRDLILRLLELMAVDQEIYLSAAAAIYSHIPASQRQILANRMLERGFLGSEQSLRLEIGLVFRDAAETATTQQLVQLMTQPTVTAAQLADYLTFVMQAPARVTDKVASGVGELTERIVARNHRELPADAYENWSSLIDRARSTAPDAHLRACASALPYAQTHPQLPLSRLIITTFPTIYRRLVMLEKNSDITFIPFTFIPVSLFIDLDRPKSARNELVDSYLKSRWPPADLWVTAQAAGIGQKVLKRLATTRTGESYLSKMWRDVDRLKPSQARAARDALAKFI